MHRRVHDVHKVEALRVDVPVRSLAQQRRFGGHQLNGVPPGGGHLMKCDVRWMME